MSCTQIAQMNSHIARKSSMPFTNQDEKCRNSVRMFLSNDVSSPVAVPFCLFQMNCDSTLQQENKETLAGPFVKSPPAWPVVSGGQSLS